MAQDTSSVRSDEKRSSSSSRRPGNNQQSSRKEEREELNQQLSPSPPPPNPLDLLPEPSIDNLDDYLEALYEGFFISRYF